MSEHDDNWNEPEAEYDDEHNACPHGIAPKWDCDWCERPEK
ncbi:hypothetical protein PCO31110_01640 [Pandoraea communis]|uniref:Uncharacterized protein n=1 Tax=Pandoraea communis TaxID=2508297 RepID=A0A5E4TZX6_9BURK|nr:hypothetical protein PCO31110_01640 [Pandoraea communis]